MFTIYYLRRLKVLDGIAVDPEEQGSAKEVYSGRLTIELLEEKIGAGSVVWCVYVSRAAIVFH